MEIGDSTVDLERGLIARAGAETHISPLAASVLQDLIEARGEVVATEDLIDRHWRTEVTTPNAVHKVVNELRRALGDDAREGKYIETIPKRGYRLSAPNNDRPQTEPGRRLRTVGLALLAISVISLGVWAFLRTPTEHEPPALAPNGQPLPPTPTLLVNDFENLSADQELGFIAARVANTIRNSLSTQLAAETVAARPNRPPSADYRVDGSISHNADDVRLSVRLVRNVDDIIIWSHQYHAPNAQRASLGDLHGANIAHLIDAMVFRDILPYDVDGVAKQHFLTAVGEMVAWSLGMASDWHVRVRNLEQAAALSPTSVDPMRFLAIAYIQRLGLSISWQETKAKTDHYLGRASALQPDQCMTKYMSAQAASMVDWNYRESIRLFENAASECPMIAGLVDLQLSFIARTLGSYDQALAQTKTASRAGARHDQVALLYSRGWTEILLGRYDQACKSLDAAWATSGKAPGYFTRGILLSKTVACHRLGDRDCVDQALEKAWTMVGATSPDWFPGVFAMTGKTEDALELLSDMETRHAAGKWVFPGEAVRAYYYLGDYDAAFRWMQVAIDERLGSLVSELRSPHFYTRLKTDERFPLMMSHIESIEQLPEAETLAKFQL